MTDQGRKPFPKCVVPACVDLLSKRHTFPKNDPTLFRKWIKQVRNSKLDNKTQEEIYKTYRVCDLHFSDYDRVPGTKRGLRKNAVPTEALHETVDVDEQPADNLEICEVKPMLIANPILKGKRFLEGLFVDHSLGEVRSVQLPKEMASVFEKDKTSDSPKPGTSHSIDGAIFTSVMNQSPSRSHILTCQPRQLFSPNSDKASTSPKPRTSHSVDGAAFTRSVVNQSPIRSRILTGQPRQLFTPKSGCRRGRGVLNLVNVTRQSELTPKAKKLYKTVIDWGNKMAVMGNRLKSYQNRVRIAESSVKMTELNNVFECVNEPTYNFILSQVKTQKQKPKARKFSVDDKVLALSLMKSSGKGYRFLSKIFSLPSRKTLTNFLNRIPLRPGINEHLFLNLKESVQKMPQSHRCCVLMFDEMSLSSQIQYNEKEDIIEGIDTSGSSPGLVDHTNVFMLQGLHSRWKQPLTFTFSDGPVKSMKLKQLIEEVIRKCQEIGLHVICTVCDQGGANQAAINSLLKHTEEYFKRQGQENKFFGFLINNQEVVPLYDVPHLFKGIRNNLLEKDLHFHFKSRNMVAKWQHIVDMYHLDSNEEEPICTKLTERHVMKDSINKMKVSTCMQVFSFQVGSLMKGIVNWGNQDRTGLDSAALDTAELLLFMDKLFDSLNVNSKVPPSTKPLKGGVTINSEHEKYWRMAIKVLGSMKFYSSKKQSFVTVPSVKNLIHTIKAFIYLKPILLSKFKLKYILTRFFNQDPLENFFSYIRAHGVRNNSPGPTHFASSFKTLLLNNFMCKHSPFSNCEEDLSSKLLGNLKTFILSDVPLRNLHVTRTLNAEVDIPNFVPLYKKTKIGRCTITYYAGYIAKKVNLLVSKFKCETCKNNLVVWGSDADIDFIKAREYKQNLFIRPGGYLTFIVSQAVPLLYYLIPRLAGVDNISIKLKVLLFKHIEFKPINCLEHDLKTKICTFLIKCALHFWCKKVNKICSGQELKFVKFVKNSASQKSIDPIKMRAYKKWENKRKLNIKKKQ